MRISYIGNFSQPFCTESHISATAEDMGHEVLRFQENEQVPGQLASKVKGYDLVLWTRTWPGFVSHQDLKDIEALDIPTVSWHLDLYVGLQRQSGLDDDPFWKTKFVLTPDGDPHSAEIFKNKGINHHYLKPGVYKAECNYGNFRSELAHDVIFVGGGLEYGHLKEWPYRRQLVQWLMDTYGNRFGKYGHPQRTMRNQDLNDLYASSKIAIGDSVCIDFKHEMYWSDRTYETLGREGFIIHPYIRGMEQEFTDKENIVFYEFGNFKQLKELIDYYIVHDDERERIRRAGHEYVKENCTYHNRLQQMLDIVFPNPQKIMIDNTIAFAEAIDEANKDKTVKNPAPQNTSLADVIINRMKSKTTRLNLGAGKDIKTGEEWLNLDLLELPGIQVVHNLVFLPYPFEDEQFEYVQAVDLIEHLPNYTPDWKPMIVAFIEEMYRILKPGGTLYMQTPGYNAEFAWQDVTHVRSFHSKSFDLFDETTEFGRTTNFYSKARFSVRSEELPNHNLRFWLTKREPQEAR